MRFLAIAVFLSSVSFSGSSALADQEDLVSVGNKLAAVLRAGRAVVSANQPLINDASQADKGLTPDVFMAQVATVYSSQNADRPILGDLSEIERVLVEAQLEAMASVVAEQQPLINAPDLGFKGFIPAVFARLVNEQFGETVGELASVKVTAPIDLVRNRKARPDAWETAVITEKFLTGDWTRGEPWYEEINETTFRMLIPEYYSESCLSCHGETAGEVDITGFPKEGGKEGQLGGAISIILRE
ncbi:MAG: DUF3365 domain-containing protein [Paracoccaceae bacterium]